MIPGRIAASTGSSMTGVNCGHRIGYSEVVIAGSALASQIIEIAAASPQQATAVSRPRHVAGRYLVTDR